MSNERSMMSEEYLNTQIENYLLLNPTANKSKVKVIIERTIKERFKDKLIANVIIDKGEYVVKKTKLTEFVNTTRDKVVSPSGSIYNKADVQPSITSGMVRTRISERDQAKLEGHNAGQRGDRILALSKHYEQANKKINVNALPGAFNSPYNTHYDKGNYNSITSLGRAVIKTCYTLCEQLLGGNFHWETDEDIINYITTHIRNKPSDESILKQVEKWNIKIPTVDELISFIQKNNKKYAISVDVKRSIRMVKNLTEMERTYIYYVNNLFHVIWENESVFIPKIKGLFKIDDLIIDDKRDPKDLLKMDKDLLTVILSNFNSVIRYVDENGNHKNRTIPGLVEHNPDGARKLLAIGDKFKKFLDPMWELMLVLVNNKTNISDVQSKHRYKRNTTIGSDTDSIIFSCHKWIELYTHEPIKTTPELYEISSLVIYWLVKMLVPTLYKYSIAHGTTEKDSGIMIMKNEFLQPLFIGFLVKKHYASITTIIEGNVLIKPKVDVKGLSLKSSTFPQKTQDFIDDILVKDILKAAENGRISGKTLIDKCLEQEWDIYNSIKNGELDYLKSVSVKPANTYVNPISSNNAYGHFWNEVFSKRFGKIEMPSKPMVVTLNDPDMKYIIWLQDEYPKTYKLMSNLVNERWDADPNVIIKRDKNPDFKPYKTEIQRWKKLPTKLAIGGQYGKIPKEITPLVAYRNIIFENMSSVYFILQSVGIEVYTSKSDNKLTLLMDQY